MLRAIVLADLGSPSEQFVIALREASESDNRESRKTAGAALELLKKKVRFKRQPKQPLKRTYRWTEGDSRAPGPNPRQRIRLEPRSQPPRRQYIYQSCLDHLLSLLTGSLRKWFRTVNNNP